MFFFVFFFSYRSQQQNSEGDEMRLVAWVMKQLNVEWINLVQDFTEGEIY